MGASHLGPQRPVCSLLLRRCLWRVLIVSALFSAVVIATKNINILVLYLISDLVSAAIMPAILLGLSSRLYFLRGFEIIVGGFGGFFTIFLFGLVYYDGDAATAGGLLILEKGLYAEDWSAFGAFTAAYVFSSSPLSLFRPLIGRFHSPIGSILWTFGAFLLRWAATEIYCRYKGEPCNVWTRKEIDLHRVAGNALIDEPQTETSSDDDKSP